MPVNRLTFTIAVVVTVAGLACDRPSPTTPESTSERSTQSKSGDDPEPPQPDPAPPRGARFKASDAHTHLGPQAYPIVDRVLEQEGIFRVINLSGGHDPKDQSRHLRALGPLADRVALFFNVDWSGVSEPDFGETLADELEAAVQRGFAGLKIHKALGLSVEKQNGELLEVDTPKLDPLWARAGELGVPVTIHTGDPKAFFQKPGPDNERHAELELAPDWSAHGPEYPSRQSLLNARDHLLEKHPDTTFILAHLGNNPEDLDYVDNLLETYPNAVVDTSARIAEFGRHPADEVREFFIKHQDRILFGTDLGIQARRRGKRLAYSLFLGSVRRDRPTLNDVPIFFERHWRYFESDQNTARHPIPIQGDWKVHPIDLPQEVRHKVYWKNAERIVFAPWLGRTRAHRAVEQARQLVRSIGDSTSDE
jgi:predicted TIM-barrel fold metal-dependent hydrolase